MQGNIDCYVSLLCRLQKRATQDSQQPRYEAKKGREGLNSMEQRRSDFSGDGKTYEYKGLDDSKRPSVDSEFTFISLRNLFNFKYYCFI